jgi:demethylmenaquinone methyltransferase/2-methoxy-6-polyprenyl-1,4-benzoquinol methylase
MVELRGTEKRIYVADMFSRISGRYDLMNAIMTLGMDRRWRKLAAETAAYSLEGSALDVATGTGDLAFQLAKTVGITRVTGLDLIEPMITRAQKKARNNKGSIPVSFIQGDALALPFPDDSFACVTSAFSLRNMPDVPLSLKEMRRVVKPGGKVLSLETMPSSRGFFRPLVRVHFRTIVPILGAIIAGDRSAYTYLPRSVEGFHSSEALANIFKASGLTNIRHKSLAFGAVHLHWGTKTN